MPSISTPALRPRCAVPPAVIGPCIGTTPSLRVSTLKRPRTGGSLSWPSKQRTALPTDSVELGADAGVMRDARGRRVVQQAQRHAAGIAPSGAGGAQRMQHAGGVAVGAGAGVVLRVGDDHRLVAALGQRQRALHRLGRAAAGPAPSRGAVPSPRWPRAAPPCARLRHRGHGRRPPGRIRRSRPPGSPSRSSGARRCVRPARPGARRRRAPAPSSCTARSAAAGRAAAPRAWPRAGRAPTARPAARAQRAPVSAPSTCG